MRNFRVRRLGYALGAEITGLDLAAPLGDETIAAIRAAWLEHIVLCFPGQDLEPEQLMAFAARFGKLDDNRTVRFTSHPDYPAVTLHVNKPITINGKRAGGHTRANKWHSDRSFTDRPSSAAFLLAKELPEVGGNTMFANAYMAYETLSPRLKELLESLSAVHDYTLTPSFERLSPQERIDVSRANPPVVHRVAAVHPETGRKSLFVGERVRAFLGMTEEETEPLLSYLKAHATRYEFIYRHVWSTNDLLMWDNRCSLHYAVQDYDQSALRRMFKVSLLAPKSGYVLADPSRTAVPA